MILANKITELRKKAGWSQEELADQLGVSRQAVSKWEGAQSVPDLDRVIAMSRVFGVSTDYLLKDELEGENPAPADLVGEEHTLRRVTMEEASEYLSHVREHAKPVALAVSTCILSPIPLMMLSALADMNRLSETAAAVTGIVLLLVAVAIAVVVFIRYGMKNEPYEYLEKEPIDTAYGVSGMVSEMKKEHRSKYTRRIIAGVVLCVLSPVPLLCTTLMTDIAIFVIASVCALLAIVAVAAYLFVSEGMVEGSFHRLLEEGDYTRTQKAVNRSPWLGVYWCVVTAIYLGWSFYTGDWHRTWMIWPVAGLLFAALAAALNARKK